MQSATTTESIQSLQPHINFHNFSSLLSAQVTRRSQSQQHQQPQTDRNPNHCPLRQKALFLLECEQQEMVNLVGEMVRNRCEAVRKLEEVMDAFDGVLLEAIAVKAQEMSLETQRSLHAKLSHRTLP
eukprot:PhF_6_TR30272/c0_g1_i1/m.44431